MRGPSARVLVLSIVFAGAGGLYGTLPARAQEAARKKADKESGDRHSPGQGKLNFWSPEREFDLGRRMSAEVEANTRLFTDPEVTEYVREVTERLARHADIHFPVVVRIIDSSQVDAFTLPGGFLYVTTGMLLETRSEAELAAVLAHEVGHVAARHATRQMSKSELMNWATMPLLFIGGPVAYAARQGLALAFPLARLKFSRNDEREADVLGIQYLVLSGYDPVAVVEFFERVGPKPGRQGSGIARLLSTHPINSERIVAAQKTMQGIPELDEYVLSTSRHDQMRSYLERLYGSRRTDKNGLTLRRKTEGVAPPQAGDNQ